MVSHTNSVCGSICHRIRNIGIIYAASCAKIHVDRSCTPLSPIARTLTSATPCLLHGLPRSTTSKRLRCRNMAACVITRPRKLEHMAPALRELHWLPEEQRVNCKVLMQAYKALHGLAPDYTVDLPHWYQPGRALRSSTDGHLLDGPWITSGHSRL